jgi:hypothetical protein
MTVGLAPRVIRGDGPVPRAVVTMALPGRGHVQVRGPASSRTPLRALNAAGTHSPALSV